MHGDISNLILVGLDLIFKLLLTLMINTYKCLIYNVGYNKTSLKRQIAVISLYRLLERRNYAF